MPKKTNRTIGDLLEYEFLNFRTAKIINNDLILLLRVIEGLRMETGVGKEVKEWFEKMLTDELEKLESCKLVL